MLYSICIYHIWLDPLFVFPAARNNNIQLNGHQNIDHSVKIFVKIINSNKKTIELYVNLNDSILLIKKKIESQQNIPINIQTLMFNGKELNNTDLLSNCNITDGCTIPLILTQKMFQMYVC